MKKNTLLALAVISAFSFAAAAPALAADAHAPLPPRLKWSFAGPFGKFDKGQIQRGFKVYREVCQACHQADGAGLEGAFPPLAVSEWLTGRAVVPIAIVLHGVQGPITVKGKEYNSAMTPWASMLNDEDLAATLTYARSQWGNRAAPVTAAQVRAVRARFTARTTPWTAAELKAIK